MRLPRDCCAHETLLAFSRKLRGTSPSCGARHHAETWTTTMNFLTLHLISSETTNWNHVRDLQLTHCWPIFRGHFCPVAAIKNDQFRTVMPICH
jgi:hypothetical protein